MPDLDDRLNALQAGLRRSRIINGLLGVALAEMSTIACIWWGGPGGHCSTRDLVARILQGPPGSPERGIGFVLEGQGLT